MILGVFLAVFGLVFLFSRLAPAVGLMAYPGEHRVHSQPTPMVGGLAIYVGVLIWCFLVDSAYIELLPGLTLVVLIGVIDDRFNLPSWIRFVVQAIAVYSVVHLAGIQLISLGELISDETLLLGQWAMPLTIFAIVGVINALNMSDGLDGLAGCITIIVLIALISIATTETNFHTMLIAAILGFLFWNVRIFRTQAKVYLGDAGSTMLGFLLGFLLIKASQGEGGFIQPVTALWFLAVPLIDAVTVLIVRPLRGSSPFSADRIHYHHRLLDRGFSVNQVLVCSVALHAGFVLLGILFQEQAIAQSLQFYLFLGVFAAYLISNLLPKGTD